MYIHTVSVVHCKVQEQLSEYAIDYLIKSSEAKRKMSLKQRNLKGNTLKISIVLIIIY